jgi:hypothetical protein
VQVFLDQALGVELHVVAQVVETEFVVGAVGDVRPVGLQALCVGEPVQDGAHRHAQKVEDLAHPLGVALGQVVVDRDDVHAAAGQGVEIGRQRGHQGLAFTGFHLGDAPAVQHRAADDLDIEVAHLQGAHGCLADHGKSFHQQIVQGLAPLDAFLVLACQRPEPVVAERLHFRLQLVDRIHNGLHAFHLTFVLTSEYFCQYA